jgi:hypothetical protein
MGKIFYSPQRVSVTESGLKYHFLLQFPDKSGLPGYAEFLVVVRPYISDRSDHISVLI